MPRKFVTAIVILTVFGLAVPVWGASVSLELRGGYRMPTSADFKEVYKGGPVFGGQLDVRITGGLSAWADVEFFSRTGKLTFTEEETKIRIIPVSAGLKIRLTSTSLCPYLAAGAGYFLYKEENIIGTVDGGALGFLGQAGLLIKLGKSFSLDVFGRYLSAKSKAEEPDILAADFSGFQGGLGLVIGF